MPEVKKTKESLLDSEPQNDIPEYEAFTVQLTGVTDIMGNNIDRISKSMPSVGKIEVQKDWVFIWPAEVSTARRYYEKIPMTAVRKIKYQEKNYVCAKEAS